MKLENQHIVDYRVAGDSPFIGLLIPVNWDNKDELRKLLLDNQSAANKIEKIKELIEKESDLDLHPEAEELDINRRIIGILTKFKQILENKND